MAGARTEPPVSVPSAKSHKPFDTAAAEPEDEPPECDRRAAVHRGAEMGVLAAHGKGQLVRDRLADKAGASIKSF